MKTTKYKLLKNLIGVATGVIFEWDEKANKYVYTDWGLTKDTVEKNPEWFEEVKQ